MNQIARVNPLLRPRSPDVSESWSFHRSVRPGCPCWQKTHLKTSHSLLLPSSSYLTLASFCIYPCKLSGVHLATFGPPLVQTVSQTTQLYRPGLGGSKKIGCGCIVVSTSTLQATHIVCVILCKRHHQKTEFKLQLSNWNMERCSRFGMAGRTQYVPSCHGYRIPFMLRCW